MTILTIILQANAAGASSLNMFLLLFIIVVIIIVAVKPNNKEDNVSISEDQTNKVVNVFLTGGLIGLFSSSPSSSINSIIKSENANGWKVIQVIPADSGNIFLYILRLLLLLITHFLFTTVNGYYVIIDTPIDNITASFTKVGTSVKLLKLKCLKSY